MLAAAEFRELLIADLALRRGVADAAAVTAALHRRWEEGAAASSGLPEILREGGGVSEESLRGLETAVDALIAEAGGDALAALVRWGSLDPAVSVAATGAMARRAREGADPRAAEGTRLRRLEEGRYVDFLPVGKGGMGVVYAALDTELHRVVALKMVRTEGEGSGSGTTSISPLGARPPREATPDATPFHELRARFLQEAWVTGGLEHPGIVPVHELGETPTGIPFYTMRFIEGQRTLASALREARDEPIDRRLLLLEPFLKLCDTVAYAHAKGVIHRDLKPENVALGDFGEVILLDWGLAKLTAVPSGAEAAWQERIRQFREAGDLRTVAGLLGTPGYMAPEVALGRLDQVDARSDLYSLGVILFEILTGRPPYRPRSFLDYVAQLAKGEPPDPAALDPSVPRGLAALCLAALAREKQARPAGAAEVAAAIRAWQTASVLDREVESLCRRADEALDRAGGLRGAARLAGVDQAAAALLEATAKRPQDPRAQELAGRVEALRARGLAEHRQETLRGARRRTAAGIGALVLLVGVGWLGSVVKEVLDARAEEGRRERAERDAADALARAAERPALAAVEALEALVRAHPDAAAVPEARFRRGERLREAGQPERAEAAWVEAWLLHAASTWGIRAWLELLGAMVAQGRHADASDAFEEGIRWCRPEGRDRALALQHAVEALWGVGRRPEALARLAELAAIREHLPAAEARRLRRLEHVLEDFRTCWERGQLSLAEFEVGRFRPGETGILLRNATTRTYRLHRLTERGIGEETLLEIDIPCDSVRLKAADLDGDGVDELVHVPRSHISMADLARRAESLRILDLRGPVVRERFRTRVPQARHTIGVGDVDHDGRPDLVLGRGYPGRGIEVLRADGRGGYERMPLGSMAALNEGVNNVRSVTIADLTGDGRNEVVVGCAEWSLYDLRVFQHASPTDGFVEIAVRAPHGRDRLGLPNSLLLHDLPEAGGPAVVFGQDFYPYAGLREALPDFLPQGLHAAVFDAQSLVFRIQPWFATGSVRRDPAQVGDAPPVTLGVRRLVAARRSGRPSYLVAEGVTHRGYETTTPWLAIHAAEARGEAPFHLGLPSQALEVRAVDEDGDGTDQVLVMGEDGVLRAFGPTRNPAPEARAPMPPPPPTGARSPESTRLAVAEWLANLGWNVRAEEAYRELLSRGGDDTVRDLADLGRVDAVARQERWDDAVALLREGLAGRALRRRERRARLAHYLDRTLQWEEAAREYLDLARMASGLERETKTLKDRARELEPWRSMERVPLPVPESWAVTAPGQFRVEGDRIEVGNAVGNQAALWVPLVGEGGAFRLSFDVVIHDLPVGHLLQVGFLHLGSASPWINNEGAFLVIEGTTLLGTAANLRHLTPERYDGGHQQKRLVALGVRYHVVLAWDDRGGRLGVTLRRADTGALDVCAVADLPRGEVPSPLCLGIWTVGEGWPGRTQLTLSGLQVERPEGGQGFAERPFSDPLEAAHLALALGRSEEALARYRAVAEGEAAGDPVRRAVARLHGAVLSWGLHPTEPGLATVLDLLVRERRPALRSRLAAWAFLGEDGGRGGPASEDLVPACVHLLAPSQQEILGAGLFRRALARWREDPSEAPAGALPGALRVWASGRLGSEGGAGAVDALLEEIGVDLAAGEAAALRRACGPGR